MIWRITSAVPPPMRLMRASAYARAIGYSHMYPATKELQALVHDAALQLGADQLGRRGIGRIEFALQVQRDAAVYEDPLR